MTRKQIHGIDTIILKEYEDGGFISVDEGKLTTEVIYKIKADKHDTLGWKKYSKILKEMGYDVE